MSIGLDDIFN